MGRDLRHPGPGRRGDYLIRAWHRFRSRHRARRIGFAYSPLYRVDLGQTPIDLQRSQRILTFLLADGLLRPRQLLRPHLVSLRELRLAHDGSYLELLRQPAALKEILGVEVWPELHEQALLAQRAAVGGTVLATREAIRDGKIVVNLGGGFHHAGRDSGRGFCIFNDVAVAIGTARRQGFSDPILVLDLDLHDGNGTREIFADDGSVFTLSIHNQSWDSSPALASLAIELPGEIDDQAYSTALQESLPRVLDDVQPGLVFYLAGTDPAHDDRIGNWKITPAGMLVRDRYVIDQIHRRNRKLPLVILLAGGYGQETWRYSARFFAWLLTGSDRIEPPSTTEMTLARYRHLTRELGGYPLDTSPDREDWGLTEADVLGGFGLEARRSQFLGHYSHHAIELTLEWTGILDRLRQMGFSHPVLALDLDNPSGHTARIFADPSGRELLVEIRLRIDRGSLPHLQLLSLEWLLLQNPRADFSGAETPLPGQRHPGLGLVPDIMSLLILMADQLELDGLTFVPSHYHLALKARKFLRFLKPADEGWFRAVEGAVGALSLAEATGAVAQGLVQDRKTERPVEWRPMQMVLAISDRLHDRVGGETYECRAVETAEALDFMLRRPARLTPQPVR
jgi:acetoin utilization deacetylase AcuC-like enzyme